MTIIPPNKEPSPSSGFSTIRLLAMIFSVGVALGSGIGYGFIKFTSAPDHPPVQTEQSFNRVGYERLVLGMSVTDVEAILGQGAETYRSSVKVILVWANDNGSKITVTFENNKLVTKEQFGLK